MGTVLHVGTSSVPYRRTGPCGSNVTWDSCAMWERVPFGTSVPCVGAVFFFIRAVFHGEVVFYVGAVF
jgi:hypothetical protein